ncbi:hypothetical protein WR25_16441 isoform B [Diploscapter pachys]|nr:hypothetical protein WR25_16441 isoform B [Diploscapter pachys]
MITEERFEFLFSLSASAMFVGLLVGFASMGWLMDNLGRKETAVYLRCFLGVLGSVSMLSAHLTGFCEFFIFGHFIAGVVGGLKVVLIIYMAECSPDNKRGLSSVAINSGGQITLLLITPLCLPALIGTDDLWFLLPCLTALMALLHLSIAAFFPQSPKQLYIQKHDEEAARKSLRFYYGDNKDIEIDEAIFEMDAENASLREDSMKICGILKHDDYRFSFFLVFICAIVPVFSAFNIKTQYFLRLLISYGLTQSEATTAMLIISAVSVPVCFIAPILIERIGRRPIFVTITLLCTVEWIGLGLAQTFTDFGYESSLIWLTAVVGAILGQIAVNLGLLIMAPILMSEICPHNTRATISLYTQVPPMVIAAVEVTIFPTLRGTFGSSFFFFCAIACFVMAIILYMQMLETAGLPIDEILQNITMSCRHTRRHTVGAFGIRVFNEYGTMKNYFYLDDDDDELNEDTPVQRKRSNTVSMF